MQVYITSAVKPLNELPSEREVCIDYQGIEATRLLDCLAQADSEFTFFYLFFAGCPRGEPRTIQQNVLGSVALIGQSNSDANSQSVINPGMHPHPRTR